MEKIYEQLKDLHIKTFIIYGKAADGKIYEEAAYTHQVKQADLEDMFMKGLVLVHVDTATYCAPVKIAANKVYTLATETADSKTVAKLVEWTAAATA